MRARTVLSEPASSLGEGILWSLFESGRLRFLFTERLVSTEQWLEWAKNTYTHRNRQIGEKLEEDEPWIPSSLS